MASIKKALEGFLKPAKKKAPTKKTKKDPVKIISLSRQSDVPKILKIAKMSPILILSIKKYRKKNKKSLKKSLEKLKEDGEPEEIKSKLLDQNWVVVMAPNTELVR